MACHPCSGQENVHITEEDWEELFYSPPGSKQWEGVFSTNKSCIMNIGGKKKNYLDNETVLSYEQRNTF